MTDPQPYRAPFSIVVAALSASIILTYIAFWFASPQTQNLLDYVFAVIPARFDPQSQLHFATWYEPLGPLFGHAWLHGAWWHAAVNAFFLYALGRVPALHLGWARFLLLYLVSAAAGALAFVAFNWGGRDIAVGASDGVCGVFVAYFLSVRPRWQDSLRIPLVRNQLGMIIFLNVVVMGVLAELNVFPIAWEGHLGGFLGGFLAYVALEPRARRA